MKTTISCDVGKKGAFAVFKGSSLVRVFDMPLLKTITQEKRVRYKHKNKKTVYKTGLKKGLRPTVVVKPEKHRMDIDFASVVEFFREYEDNPEVVFLSEPQYALGHGKTIYQNYGVILGIAISHCDELKEIRPQQWQKHFGIDKSDKNQSNTIAGILFPSVKFTRHDQSEAALIGAFYLEATCDK